MLPGSRKPRSKMRIGILAVQGDYEAHARMLDRLGADYSFVRTPQEAEQAGRHDSARRRKHHHAEVPAGRRPGGAAAVRWPRAAARSWHLRGHHSPGARSALARRRPRSVSPIWSITRNAYGRQIASGVRTAPRSSSPSRSKTVFIRAPIIEAVGPDVEVLASETGHPVLVRQGKC